MAVLAVSCLSGIRAPGSTGTTRRSRGLAASTSCLAASSPTPGSTPPGGDARKPRGGARGGGERTERGVNPMGGPNFWEYSSFASGDLYAFKSSSYASPVDYRAPFQYSAQGVGGGGGRGPGSRSFGGGGPGDWGEGWGDLGRLRLSCFILACGIASLGLAGYWFAGSVASLTASSLLAAPHFAALFALQATPFQSPSVVAAIAAAGLACSVATLLVAIKRLGAKTEGRGTMAQALRLAMTPSGLLAALGAFGTVSYLKPLAALFLLGA